MLHILLMILKILGILLLVILGIILAVLLVVLFVPLRYRVDASFDGKPQGGVLVSWLLHLVTVRVSYDGAVKALVKVLWFRLFDKTVWPAEDSVDESLDDVAGLEDLGSLGDIPDPSGDVGKPTDTVKPAEEKLIEPVIVVEDTTSDDPVQPVDTVKAKEPMEPAPEQKKAPDTTVGENSGETENAEKKPWMEAIVEKLVSLTQKTIEKISCTYQQICGKLDAGQEKIELARAFLSDSENQNTLKLLWKQVKKLLRHVLPRTLRGRVRFGFDDPATTGQILTYISPFYGLYAKTLVIEPVFDEKVMEGELHIKGHIRVASLLWIVIRVFLNKNFRKLLKQLTAMGKK